MNPGWADEDGTWNETPRTPCRGLAVIPWYDFQPIDMAVPGRGRELVVEDEAGRTIGVEDEDPAVIPTEAEGVDVTTSKVTQGDRIREDQRFGRTESRQ